MWNYNITTILFLHPVSSLPPLTLFLFHFYLMGILSACPKSHCTISSAPDSWDDTWCHTQHCFPLFGSSLNAFSWKTFFLGGGVTRWLSDNMSQSIQDWWKERIPYVILYPPLTYHGKWSFFSVFLIAKSLSCSILVLLRLIVVFHSPFFGGGVHFFERWSHVWGQANLTLAVSLHLALNFNAPASIYRVLIVQVCTTASSSWTAKGLNLELCV